MVSDLAAVVVALITEPVDADAHRASLLVALTAWVLWRTPFGLRLRSCGENPQAAETLGVNVYRYKYIAVVDLRRARRHRRRLPGAGGVQRLRHRPDRRPRLHRPRGDDLRQLASRRHARRLADVRLHRHACGCARRRPVHALLLLVAIGLRRAGGLAVPRKQTAPAASCSACSVRCSCVLVPLHRRGAARVHRHDALRRDAAGAGASPPNGCACPRRTARSTARAAPDDAGCARRPADVDWDGAAARGAVEVMGAPTRRTPTSRSARPPGSTTAGSWSAATSRTRRTASGCAPSAAWSRRCTPPAAAGSPTPCASTARGEVIMPCGRCRQLLFENGGPELLLLTVSGVRADGRGAAGCVRSRRPRLT